ncbi:MAG: type III-B CRISPR module-associated protein Cmr5 [Planctomycetota bacterium]
MTAIRDHQRAILAERHVRAVFEKRAEQAKAYGAVCMKLPILVHQAGLAAALHHVAQLSKTEKREILDHLAAQLREGGLLTDGTRDGLLRHTREASATQLLAATREAQRCLEWYRGFAKTILKVEPGEDE